MKNAIGRSLLVAAVVCAGAMGARAAEVAASSPVAKFLTRGELEKIPLASVADPATVEGALVFPETRVGILLPKGELQEGDAIPAWLIVKSTALEPSRGIPAIFDLGETGEKPKFDGTARVQLVRVKGEDASKEEVIADVKGKSTRTTKRVMLPAEGFLVNSGDVRNLAGTGKKALVPGDYVLRFWAEGQRAEAGFRVVARTTPLPAATAPAEAAAHDLMVMNWVGGMSGRPNGKGGQQRLTLRNGYLAPDNADDFQMGLAMGVGTGPAAPYFSRIKDVPAEDDTLSIAVVFTPGKNEKVQITLTPKGMAAPSPTTAPATASATGPASEPATRAAAGEAQLPAYLTIYLLVENMGPPTGVVVQAQRPGGPSGGANRFVSPLVIDAQLPPGWNNQLNFEGKARVSVMVASDPVLPGIEGPGEADLQNMMNVRNRYAQMAVRAGRGPVGKRWVGIVKSAPVELTVKQGAGE